jgi:enoyl-CoA hydratase/carnithine racemase
MALVEYAVTDGVAHIELNRPEAANAFDLDTTRELAAIVERAVADPGVRALLVTGAGARFCAGGDLASFAAARTSRPIYTSSRSSSTRRAGRWRRSRSPSSPRCTARSLGRAWR